MVASYSLPSRTTRGQRVAELVGEAADADAVFWGVNHEIWKEDNEGYAVENKIYTYVIACFKL